MQKDIVICHRAQPEDKHTPCPLISKPTCITCWAYNYLTTFPEGSALDISVISDKEHVGPDVYRLSFDSADTYSKPSLIFHVVFDERIGSYCVIDQSTGITYKYWDDLFLAKHKV